MNEVVSPIIYTPQQPPSQPPPQPQYELKHDVSGEAPPVRGPIFIEASIPGPNNERTKVRVQVPHLPKSGCKLCYGKGYVGFEIKSQKVMFCHKCYRPSK